MDKIVSLETNTAFYDRIVYLCKSMADNNPSVKTQKLESNMKKFGKK